METLNELNLELKKLKTRFFNLETELRDQTQQLMKQNKEVKYFKIICLDLVRNFEVMEVTLKNHIQPDTPKT